MNGKGERDERSGRWLKGVGQNGEHSKVKFIDTSGEQVIVRQREKDTPPRRQRKMSIMDETAHWCHPASDICLSLEHNWHSPRRQRTRTPAQTIGKCSTIKLRCDAQKHVHVKKHRSQMLRHLKRQARVQAHQGCTRAIRRHCAP